MGDMTSVHVDSGFARTPDGAITSHPVKENFGHLGNLRSATPASLTVFVSWVQGTVEQLRSLCKRHSEEGAIQAVLALAETMT